TTQTATYTVTPNANGCSGNTFSVSASVFPTPIIPTQTITICSGSSFTFSPVNNLPTSVVPVGTKYSWSLQFNSGGITGGTSGTNQTAIIQTLVNVSNTPQTVTYLVTPMTNTNGNCSGNPFTLSVIVNPTPIIPNQSIEICSGSSFTISPVNIFPSFVVPTGTTYTWASPIVTGGLIGGVSGSNQSTISQVLTNITNTTQTATYTVTPMTNSNGNCIGNPFTIFVTVNPTPIIPNQAITICSGNQFTNSPVNSIPSSVVPSGTTYSWSNPIVSGGMIGGSDAVNQTTISQTLTNITNTPQTATYTVTPMTNTNGNCIGNPFTINVSVKPTPTLPNQVITICNEDSLIQSFVNNPPNIIIPNNTLYSWSLPFNPGGVFGTSAATNQSTITQLLYNTSNIPQTATYTIFPISSTFGNCSGAPFYIYVTVNPTLEVSGGVNQSICAGDEVTLTASGAVTYSWNNNVINTQSFTPISTQNYIVTGIDSLGCVGSDTVTVFVSEASSSSLTQTALDAYTWPVNNQTYTQSGTYSDTLVNAAGCDSIVTLNLTLNYTGINELSTSTIAISPNPTNGDFTLTGLELFNSISSMTIIDVNGKTIKELDPKAAKFSIGMVKAGVYFLTITARNKQEVIKIIKE
ncbi:MAG: T9SS type A sorting domain-containing protein, partial [Crocinitomicaceae bacterium]|nr:T9SS type A sorting domain-containing protein [Crocinitomicaceae bacterium]